MDPYLLILFALGIVCLLALLFLLAYLALPERWDLPLWPAVGAAYVMRAIACLAAFCWLVMAFNAGA